MNKRISYVATFVAGCVLTALGLLVVTRPAQMQSKAVDVLSSPAAPVSSSTAAHLADKNLVRAAAAKLEPAVVDVHTEGRAALTSSPSDDDSFGFPFPFPFSGPRSRGGGGTQLRKGAGSGVIISADGYIVTNNHVIVDADKVTVKVGDTGYDAKVVGKDDTSDIAVVKIDPKGAKLPVAELGNSDSVQVGDWAIAIGNPLDIGTTVTLGIISAVNRTGQSAEGHALNSVLQTDAAINPGNSGGALANIDGQVIGINEAIASPTGSYVGIGFAIPINAAKTIAKELIEHGEVVRPFLGVSYEPLKAVPAEARKRLGISATGEDGLVVEQVIPDSPAAKAGVQTYDVILEANREKLRAPDSLSSLVQKLKVGDTVALLVSRNGQTRLLTAKLDKRPAKLNAPARRAAPDEP